MKSKILLLLAVFAIASSCANDKKDYIVTIHTAFGDMKVILYDETPLHKANFIELAEEGLYDSTTWHRVIEAFMIQGGGIDMKNKDMKREQVPAELVKGMMHHKGALAAARQSDQVNPEKKSSWCQFYIVQGKVYQPDELDSYESGLNENRKRGLFKETIMKPENAELLKTGQGYQKAWQEARDPDEKKKYQVLLDSITGTIMQQIEETYEEIKLTDEQKEVYTTQGGSPHLDNEYTVFGRVVEGLDVIDKIAAVDKAGSKPKEEIYLTMEVEMVPKKKITKEYGYEYPEVK